MPDVYSSSEINCSDAVTKYDSLPSTTQPSPGIPEYLHKTYHWAYLSEIGRTLLDRPVVVSTILWGNAKRLMETAASEFEPDQKVLQVACVYGDFSPILARRIGPKGRLTIIDVAPIQIKSCQRKIAPYPQAHAYVADAAVSMAIENLDAVCCFFLLHEVPEDYKARIVDNLLSMISPGGKVVFVDYHRPASWHPLKWIMALVFHWLEPFARTLWDREIWTYATQKDSFSWKKKLYFGGLYQKVVAIRKSVTTQS